VRPDVVSVLLVEDNAGDARLVADMLREWPGIELQTVGSLGECVRSLSAGCYDVVLLDLGLPDSSGAETLRAVLEAAPLTPVVAVTGLADDPMTADLVQAGAQDYLAKGTLTGDLLRRTIRHAMGRKRTQDALARSERKWRHVLASMPQIGIGLDPEGRIIFANAYFLGLTGWTEAEVLGRDWFDRCIREEQREEIRSVFHRVMADRNGVGVTSYDNPIITRSGEIREVAWSNVLTRDADGAILDVTCLGVDITERVRGEQAVRVAEERLALALKGGRDGWWDMDLVSGEVLLSPRWWEIGGYDPGELPSARETWTSLTHPDDRDVVKAAFDKALCGAADTFEVECRRRHKRGHWVPVAVRGYISRDATGRAVRVTGTTADLTEQKRAEAALAASEARFRLAITEAPIPVLIYADDGEILSMSRTWTELTGYAPADIPTIAAWTDRAYGEEREAVRADIAGLFGLSERTRGGERRVRCRDGSARVWEFTSVGLGSLPDGRRAAISMAFDVTDRKRVEEELVRQLDELRRWRQATLGREDRILELKREVNALSAKLGLPHPYTSTDGTDTGEAA